MERKKFVYKNRSLSVNPAIVGNELTKIYNKNDKKLIPETVVKEAEKKESPLNKCFEWNNDKASYLYRIHQARNIINCVAIVYKDDDKEKEVIVGAFANIQMTENKKLTDGKLVKVSYYATIEDVMKDEESKNYVLETALKELIAFQNKYKNLKELDKVFQAIELIISN